MNPFKSFTLKWWQAAFWKVGMAALGIAIGAYWHAVFGNYIAPILVLAAVSLAYVTYIWWKQ